MIKGQDGLAAGGLDGRQLSQLRAAPVSCRLLGGQIVKKLKILREH